MADSSIYLTVSGSNFDSNLQRVPCTDFTFNTPSDGRVYPKLTLRRDLDGTSVTLFRAASTGASFAEAEIEVDTSGNDGKPAPWERLTMKKGNFADDRVAGAPGGKNIEILVLAFGELKVDDVHDANGQTTRPDGQPFYNLSESETL